MTTPKPKPTPKPTQGSTAKSTKVELTAAQKRQRNLRVTELIASGAKDFVSGGNTPISTSANDSEQAEWVAEPVVNRSKEENTTDLESKTASSFLSNYHVG